MKQGKASLFAYALPDMSCNRANESTTEETRKGFFAEDWGVVAFAVRDIPPREAIAHLSHAYRLLARHVPILGNFSHSEVRVWRIDQGELLLTVRGIADFAQDDVDRDCVRSNPAEWLDPDFHMRWRKRIAQVAELVLGPRTLSEDEAHV